MLDYSHETDAEDRQAASSAEADLPGAGHKTALAQDAEDQPQAPLEEEPWFPTADDAVEANQAALAHAGHPLAGQRTLTEPGFLDSALNAAKQHWYYAEDQQPDPRQRLLEAAAKLGYHTAQAQAFRDGNKRTARALTQTFLYNNGFGHVSPLDQEDEELADHLVGYGAVGQLPQPTHTLEDTMNLFKQRDAQGGPTPRQANILDPIHDQLDPSVWDHPDAPEPVLRHEHQVWISKSIFDALEKAGYNNPEDWLTIILTGSLTTYQYSDQSDCDVSLFVNVQVLPEWSRAEMIGLMISKVDGKTLPGTPHVMQDYVVSKKLSPEDLYKPGLRSGYIVYGPGQGTWVVPPERDRVHNVEREENEAYTIALENADKMEHLLRYEPDKAVMFWHQIHKRRMRDMQAGKGDYAPSNIVYKFLDNRGLFPKLEEVSGEHIA